MWLSASDLMVTFCRRVTIMSNTTSGEDALLDIAQAAAFLGVPRSWIYSRVESSECDLPYFKVGRYLRFRASELQGYLEANRGGPTPS